MSPKKILLILALTLTVLLSAVAGVLWNMRNYAIVDFQFYPKGAAQLDLRDREITVQHYEKLIRRMPDCAILWKVPFQDQLISNDAEEIVLSALSEKDIPMLQYFCRLKTVKAETCTDYEALQALCQQRPDLTVEYVVTLGTETFSPEAEQVSLSQIAAEDIERLAYLPNLKAVSCSGGSAEAVAQLKDYCQRNQLAFQISLGEAVLPLDTDKATIAGITDAQLELLQLFPNLKQLHLRLPQASAEKLRALQQDLPNVTITWEQELCGQIFDSAATEIDLSNTEEIDLEELERQMAYFPEVNLVFLGECGLDNDLLPQETVQTSLY